MPENYPAESTHLEVFSTVLTSQNCVRHHLYQAGFMKLVLSGLVEKQEIWHPVKKGRERSSFKTRGNRALLGWQGSDALARNYLRHASTGQMEAVFHSDMLGFCSTRLILSDAGLTDWHETNAAKELKVTTFEISACDKTVPQHCLWNVMFPRYIQDCSLLKSSNGQ